MGFGEQRLCQDSPLPLTASQPGPENWIRLSLDWVPSLTSAGQYSASGFLSSTLRTINLYSTGG